MTDDVMRLFGSERVMNMMDALKVDDDTPLDHKMLSGAIENAQKTVESRNFQTRKATLEYDDVMNAQRKLIYEQRYSVLNGEDVQASIRSMITEFISNTVGHADPKSSEEFEEIVSAFYPLFLRRGAIRWEEGLTCAEIREKAEEAAEEVAKQDDLDLSDLDLSDMEEKEDA